MRKPNLDLQQDALKAVYNNNETLLLDAITKGARVELNASGLKPDKGSELPNLSIAGTAILASRGSRFENYKDIINTMSKTGTDIKAIIEDVIDPKTISINEPYFFLRTLLNHWPESFGDWKTIFLPHNFVKTADYKMTSLLLECGMDVNVQDELGRTPLMFVRDRETIERLLAAGAGLLAVDGKGKTAIWYASQHFFKKMINENDQKTIHVTDSLPLTMLSGKENLTNDPSALFIARRIGKLIEGGIQVMNGPKTYPFEFENLKPQIQAILTQERRKLLGKSLVGQRKREQSDRAQKKAPKI